MSKDDKADRAKEIGDAIKAHDDKKRADEDASGQALDGLLAKLDACMTKMDDMGTRMDALEQRKPKSADDDETLREPGEAKEVVADSDPRYVSRMANAQALADNSYAAWALRAPKWLEGEGVSDYRRRLLGPHQKYSPKYKGAALDTITDAAIFSAVEEQIYADSASASLAPENIGEGRLRMVTERTTGGHTINKFYGHPAAWMDGFAPPRRYVTRFGNQRDFK